MLPEDKQSNNKGQFPKMRPKDDRNAPKGPKFNIYWVWGAIAAILLSFQIWGSFNQDGQKINQSDFFQNMLAKGDVDKMSVVSNKKVVKVFIKADSLKKAYYQTFTSKNSMRVLTDKGPQFEFEIGDPKIFADDLREFYAKNPSVKAITANYESEAEWLTQFLGYIFPIVVIVLIWILLMRKMGGGAGGTGGPGGIFSI
jgi:cell division protease FtsH